MGLHDEVSVRDDERGVGPPLPFSLSLMSCTRAQVKAFAGSLRGKPMQVAVVVRKGIARRVEKGTLFFCWFVYETGKAIYYF